MGTLYLTLPKADWNISLDCGSNHVDAFQTSSLAKWWRVKEQITPQQLLRSARHCHRVHNDPTKVIVVAMIGDEVVGHAVWILPKRLWRSESLISSSWRYILYLKDRIEDYYDPPDYMDVRKRAIFTHEQDKCKKIYMQPHPEQWWYLQSLLVSPKHHKRGAGARLLEWGLSQARASGEKVFLEATPAGMGLYLRHGFQEVGELTVGGPDRGGGPMIAFPLMLFQ